MLFLDSYPQRKFTLPDINWYYEKTEEVLPSAKYPKVNLSVLEGVVKLEIAVPGMSKSEIKANYCDGYVTIAGENTNTSESKNNVFVIRELRKSSFKREIFIGKIDESSLTSSFENGVLLITAKLADVKVSNTINLI